MQCRENAEFYFTNLEVSTHAYMTKRCASGRLGV
jgi:hypothetical protein